MVDGSYYRERMEQFGRRFRAWDAESLDGIRHVAELYGCEEVCGGRVKALTTIRMVGTIVRLQQEF